jgi:hypothetical protein
VLGAYAARVLAVCECLMKAPPMVSAASCSDRVKRGASSLCAPACTGPGVTGGDNHFYLARSGNNTFNNYAPGETGPSNPAGAVPFYVCPSVGAGNLGANAINYGGNIYVTTNNQGPSSLNGIPFDGRFGGPQVVGMVDASVHDSNPDTITGLSSCNGHLPGDRLAAEPAQHGGRVWRIQYARRQPLGSRRSGPQSDLRAERQHRVPDRHERHLRPGRWR